MYMYFKFPLYIKHKPSIEASHQKECFKLSHFGKEQHTQMTNYSLCVCTYLIFGVWGETLGHLLSASVQNEMVACLQLIVQYNVKVKTAVYCYCYLIVERTGLYYPEDTRS